MYRPQSRALQTQELLELIFQQLWDVEDRESEIRRRSYRGTLPALARTCRTFYDPAIRVLWKRIPGLSVLTHLFPQDDFTIEDNKKIFFKRTEFLQDTAFRQRFRTYAVLVKHISYRHFTRFSMHFSALNHLATKVSVSGPLFHNAVSVVLPCYSTRPMEAMFYPAVVLGPFVRNVLIYTDGAVEPGENIAASRILGGPLTKAMLDRLHPYAANFTDFAVQLIDRKAIKCIPGIDSLCTQLSACLRRVELTQFVLSPDVLFAISQLGGLEVFLLSVDTPDRPTPIRPPAPLLFPALTHLHVEVLTMDAGQDFLRRLQAPSLTSLYLEFWLPDDDDHDDDEDLALPLRDLKPIFSVLSGRHAAPKLSSIEVDVGEFNRDAFVIKGPTLLPIVEFKDLTSITIHRCACVELDDANLLQLFSSWPKLVEFIFEPPELHTSVIYRKKLTLEGLHNALQRCPNLARLSLACDARRVPPAKGVPHQCLKVWDVGFSPIQSGRAVGEWLRQFYPRLEAASLEYFSHFASGLETIKDEKGIPEHELEKVLMINRWNDVVSVLRG
ncbi:hypothetical protein CC1G_04623 [Coprinopsis cinerea okayama7|uniref:F-box domain-containing protein n=1 Tax=Coprinopsis cinerea (strain Okayama-7 / 130 / ATCC MYA-4618 / FGSC 9003) TaxID=240176 RepID=A8N4W3_COPC7|nr:hypothetical protein CC1G_04623 [Coprinopsis cinerea okayama7\|eukprot:XP_001829934.2 hypothetical protein CC1G_04623 [Coprinopsis cinerea okayama7\